MDRKAGAAVGLYGGTVDEQYVPYIMPQENGNKTDVRWGSPEQCARVGSAGNRRTAHGSVRCHHSIETLYRARHTNELVREPEIYFNLDLCNAAWAAHPADRPRWTNTWSGLANGSFTVLFRPFDNDEALTGAWARMGWAALAGWVLATNLCPDHAGWQ